MTTGRFLISFTGLSSEHRTTIANLTAHELKQRGWNAEIVDNPSAIVLTASNSETPDVADSRHALVEVAIGPQDESGNTGEQHVTKIVLPADDEPERCVAEIFAKLEGLELIAAPASKDSSYDEDDEAMIRSRLEALGYL